LSAAAPNLEPVTDSQEDSSMDTRFRKVAVFAGVAALATGAGVAVAGQGGETATSQAASQQRSGALGGGARGGMDLSTLADELGVTTDELEAAMDAVRSSGVAPGDSLAAALAAELGLPVDDVTAALESLQPQGAAGGMRPPDGSLPPGAAPPDGSGTTPPDDPSTTPPSDSSDDGTTITATLS
jgi:hypothetical protein